MTMEDLTRCPSCGLSYVNHPGLIPTCQELQEARRWQEYLLKSNAGLEAERNATEAKLHEYLKYNYGKEDCLGCQERDAELAHYKAALAESCDNMRAEGPYEGMGICPQLQEMTAERDRYKKIVDALYAQPCNGYANCWHCAAKKAMERVP